MCSSVEQEKVFKKYGTVSSFASQRFNHLFVEGLQENNCRVTALTLEVLSTKEVVSRDRKVEYEDDIEYIYLPLGLTKAKLISTTIKEIRTWCKGHREGVVFCDTIIGELSIAINFSGIKNRTVAIVTDVPLNRANDNRKGIKRLPAYLKQQQIYHFDSYVFLTKQMNCDLNPKNKPNVVIEGFAKNDEIPICEKYSKTCLMAGLLENGFGVQLLIDAFKKMPVPDARMVFYGKGKAVQSIVDASIIDCRIVYGGLLPNKQIIEEEKKATLLINPRPNTEKWTAYSFPSKNIEYMSSGTPLVAFKLPGIPDEYDNYYYHIEENDPEYLAKLLQELLTKDIIELEEFGSRSKEWVINNKSPFLQTKKCIEMIRGY